MKTNLILFFKGIIIGLANVIPGVSGGTLMITLGIYKNIIETISHFFSNFKKNLQFIIPIGLGLLVAILLFSKIINLSLEKFPFATTLFFLGIILGGIPLIVKKMQKDKFETKKISNYIIAFITFAFIIIFAMLKTDNEVNLDNLSFLSLIILFLVGMLASSTMVIPGVSGSFVLMLVGYYKPIINTISSLTDFNLIGHNLLIIGSFLLGAIIGIVLISKLIEFLLNKYETKTYYAVFGFIMASIIAIIKPLFSTNLNVLEVLIGLVLALVGFLVAFKLSEK